MVAVMSEKPRCFVYGTLMFAPVREALLGRPVESTPAVLHGFSRYGLSGKVYPGILPCCCSRVEGLVLEPLTELDMEVLDAFEGARYRRSAVTAYAGSGDGCESILAETYVLAPDQAVMARGVEWDIEAFARDHLSDYAEMCAGFRRGVLAARQSGAVTPTPRFAPFDKGMKTERVITERAACDAAELLAEPI